MWVLTALGFFSLVRKPGETDLTVRARVRGDLEALQKGYLPALGPIIAGGGTDYPYRAKIAPKALATAIARMVEDIAYPNFKDVVAKRQGKERAQITAASGTYFASFPRRSRP